MIPSCEQSGVAAPVERIVRPDLLTRIHGVGYRDSIFKFGDFVRVLGVEGIWIVASQNRAVSGRRPEYELRPWGSSADVRLLCNESLLEKTSTEAML